MNTKILEKYSKKIKIIIDAMINWSCGDEE